MRRMSGETDEKPSSWNPDLLLIYLQSQQRSAGDLAEANHQLLQTRITDMARMLDERYTTQTKALDAAFVAAEKALTSARAGDKEAIQAALLAAKEAVEKANTANEKRFENVNEFRAQLADIQSTLISRNEAETRLVALDEKSTIRFIAIEDQIKRIQSSIDRGFTAVETKSQTGKENMATVYTLVGVLITLGLFGLGLATFLSR